MLHGQQAAILRIEPVVVGAWGTRRLARIVLARRDRVDHRRGWTPDSTVGAAGRGDLPSSPFGVRPAGRRATGSVAEGVALAASLLTRSEARTQPRRRDCVPSDRVASDLALVRCLWSGA